MRLLLTARWLATVVLLAAMMWGGLVVVALSLAPPLAVATATATATATVTTGCYIDVGPTGSGHDGQPLPGRQMFYQVCILSYPYPYPYPYPYLILMFYQVCEHTGMCTALTHESCAAACRSLNFSLYGVEAGHQCYCDDQLAHPGQLLPNNHTACRDPCAGNGHCFTNEMCGGSFQLWVGIVADAAPPQNCSPPVQPAEPRNIVNGTLMYKTGILSYLILSYLILSYPILIYPY
eukprot:SAG31_NODE_10202_length_1171_cov_2.652985_1_plen_234_part_10